MKPEELRIGNWINLDGRPMQVSISFWYLVAMGKIDLSTVFPMEITIDLLTQFRFEGGDNLGYNMNFWTISLFENDLTINPENGIVFICKKDEQIKLNIDLQYIHELQNLYYSLTGTELNINLCS